MTRGIWSKWIIGAAFLLLIIAAGCFLWYQHTTAADKQAAEQAEKLLQEWEADKAKQTITADKESTQAPADTTTPAEKPTPHNIGEDTETKTNDNTKKPVRISRYGFGVLPDIPDEAPIAPFDDNMDAEQELLALTLLKLWNDGDKNIGGGFYDPEQGKVYPYYPNVIYVEYGIGLDIHTLEQIVKIVGATSSFDNADVVDEVVRYGTYPPGYELIDVEDSGIDPYVFLDLPKR